MSIYAWWDNVDYSALKWPCPDWYHIPTQPEFNDLVTKFLSLWLWKWTFYTYYKVPMAWFAWWDSGYSFRDTWTQAKLVLATAESENRTYYTYVTTDYVAATYNLYKWYYWYSLRPFKDEPSIPDSNWTVLYQWTWNAWIYYNATEWLISLSTDWTNWITVADKNLWATTVFNTWDTLSEANCGKFYQWWNNYGFPWVGSDTTWVVTSSTKVDAGSYWPWEYSSSTFITTWADWSSVTNNNLWWWVTWVIQTPKKVKEIYVSQQEVPRLPNEYQEVNYIESHWEQAIDTWFKPLYEEEYRAVVDFEWIDQDTGEHLILWHMRNCWAWFNWWDFAITRDRGWSRIWPIYWWFTSATFTPNTYWYNTRYTFDWTWNSWQVDAMTNLVIFARKTSGVSWISMKLYSCDIYKDNDKIAEYVPCFRKSDWEIWLYNLIDDTFLANTWSWAFTKWPPLWIKSIKEVYKWNTKIRPELPLKEFTEICSIVTYTDALTELNKYPQEYYQKFLAESNIIKFNFNSILYDTLKWTESWWVRYPKYREDWGNYYILIYNYNQSQWESLQIQ